MTAGDDQAKLTARIASGRLDVLRRLASPDADDVVWVERVGRTRRLRIAPVAAGETIAHALLAWRPVVGVSATLGGDPPFPALARQMGLHADTAPGSWGGQDEDDGHWISNAGRGYASVQTPSSFDWKTQGVLYVGKDLPDPSREREAWSAQSADRLCALVNAAGGRALVLCTSHANVAKLGEVLRARTDHHVLMQGDRDSGRLMKEFVEDETSVLVGTRSFWAGIDAAGASCVLVVIDKIPFPVPDEPLHAARRGRAQRAGLDAFVAVDLPVAALVLAQGAGRLIRTKDDRGVVAVLDPRLAKQGYRAQLLAAMPPLRRSIDLAEACTFLEEVAGTQGTGARERNVGRRREVVRAGPDSHRSLDRVGADDPQLLRVHRVRGAGFRTLPRRRRDVGVPARSARSPRRSLGRRRGADDLLERGDMAAKRTPADGGEASAHAPAPIVHRPLDHEVARVLERRELFRERRVGQGESIADEREVGPVGRREERHDREARARMDQLVELRSIELRSVELRTRDRRDVGLRGAGRHDASYGHAARRRIVPINVGPPSTIATATGMLAIVTG